MSLDKLTADKPIVYYAEVQYPITVGQRVAVIPLNHEDTRNVINGYPALTSAVVSVGERGEFETRNSRYVPSRDAYLL